MSRWWQRFQRWLVAPKGQRVASLRVDDVPTNERPGMLYLVGDKGDPWLATLQCPCGCSEQIQLSLMAEDRPSWQVRVSLFGKPTLTPSVWRTCGCKAHFFVRRGRILWVSTGA